MAILATNGLRLRHRRCYSLRTLLLVLSVACVLCGWEVDRLHRRAEAIALLNRWELWVNEERTFDRLPWSLVPDSARSWDFPWPSTCSSVSYAPSWRDNTHNGRNEFDEKLNNPRASRASRREMKQLVAAIGALTELECVCVPLELDDDDLRSLSCLCNVEILGFKTRRLTAAAVRPLRRLGNLRGVVVLDSPKCISFDAIALLRELPGLLRVAVPRLPDDRLACINGALPGIVVDVYTLDE